MENQSSKFFASSKKPSKLTNEESTSKQQAQRNDKFDSIKRTSLQEPFEDYHVEIKYPQGLPLIAKKIRKCPDCKKPLTAVYRTRVDDKNKVGDKSRHG